jgi:hypothetical protein
MRLASNGVIKRLYRQEYSARPVGDDTSFQQLSIQAATPLLLVLGTGMVISVLLFALELTIHRLSAGAHKHTYASKSLASAKGRPVRKGSERRKIKKRKVGIKVKVKASEVNKMFQEAFIRKCISE